MIDHLDDTTLDDHVDGLLDDAQRDRVDEHVRGCAACRRRLEALTALRCQLAGLRRDIEPPHDLLAAVNAAIDGVDAAPQPRPLHRGWLAAAAVLLVAGSSLVTALLLRDSGAPATAAGTDTADRAVQLVAAQPFERSYEHAIEELQRELAAQESALAPETRRIVELNLQIIDRALAEARAALHADPANAALADVLRSGYERKLDVLRSAAAHTRASS